MLSLGNGDHLVPSLQKQLLMIGYCTNGNLTRSLLAADGGPGGQVFNGSW